MNYRRFPHRPLDAKTGEPLFSNSTIIASFAAGALGAVLAGVTAIPQAAPTTEAPQEQAQPKIMLVDAAP